MNWKFLLLFIPIGILPLVQSTSFSDPALLPKFTSFAIFLALSFIALIGSLYFLKVDLNMGVLRRPVIILLTTFFGYSMITSFYAYNPIDGLFETFKIGMFTLYVILLCCWITDISLFIRFFVRSILFLSTIVLGIGLYQLISIYDSGNYTFDSSYLVTARFAHRNLFSQVILFTLPVLAYEFYNSKRWLKYFSGMLVLLSCCFIVVLFVRSVWLSLVFSTIVTSAFYMYWEGIKMKRRINIKSFLKHKRPILLVLILALFLGYGMNSINADRYLKDQVRSMKHLHYGSIGDRISLWNKSFEMGKENFLVGKGLSSWKIAILKTGMADLESKDALTFYQRPHNDFIWVLCEQGILGLILYLSIFILLFLALHKLIKHQEAAKFKQFNYMLMLLLLSYSCIALFSFPKERYTHSLLLSVLIAAVVIQQHLFFPMHLKRKIPLQQLLFFTLICLVGVSIFMVRRSTSEIAFNRVLLHKIHLNWSALKSQIKKVDRAAYNMDYTSTPVSWYEGLAQFKLKNNRVAKTQFQKALQLNPYHIHTLNNLASIYYQEGKVQLSIDHYRKALSIHPHFKEANLNMAVYQFNSGITDSAVYFMQQIDTASIDPVYEQYLDVILHKRMEEIMESSKDSIEMQLLNGMYHDWGWLKSTFQKSADLRLEFKKMLEIDVDYMRKNELY